MQNKTVKELKFLAKDLGLSRYSRLRKAELIQMIEDHRRNSSSNILDETNVPILGPVQFTAKNNIVTLKSLAGNVTFRAKFF